MKKLFVCISVGIIISIAANSSYGEQYWSKTYGGIDSDGASSVQQTSDGGYIVAGGVSSFGAGDGDIWLLKLDSSGSIQWQKTYGGSDWDYSHSVQQTSDNGYIVAGYTYSFGAGNYSDAWLLKLDSSGSVQWQKTYGGFFGDTFQSVQQTSDGGYIVAGETYSFGAGSRDAWVVKLDSSGSIQWQKTHGGTITDTFQSVQQTSDGGYIVAGRTDSFGAGNGDIWLLKLDSSGSVQWQKTYGDTFLDGSRSVQQTSDGGYIVGGATGSFLGPGDEYNFWLLKLDSSGSVQWQKTYGGTEYDSAYAVQQTVDSGYIVAGNTWSFGPGGDHNVWLLKLDGSGIVQWQKTYGGTDRDTASSVQQTSDGGYIVAGRTDSFGAGSDDIWLLKLDSSGNISGCDIAGISDALVTETYIVGQPSAATITQTSISPSITNSSHVNTFVEAYDICSDFDEDGILNFDDNCPNHSNPLQEDSYPPPSGNNIGDVCDCECDFNCDGNVDATDVTDFLGDFGRSTFFNPCTNDDPCKGDVDCNVNVDADDVTSFLTDFGRSQFNNPCPTCVAGNWCIYP